MNEDRNLCETLYAPRAPSPEAPAWPVRPAFVPSNIRLAIGRDPARANEFQGPHGEIRRLRAKNKNCFFNKTRNARAKLSVIWNAISASSLLPRVTTFRTSHEFFGLIVEGSPAGQPDEPFFPSPQVFGLGSGATAQAPTPRVTIFIFVAIFVGLILPVVT